MSTTSLILPFAVPVKERATAFSSNMEIASILLLTEAKRKKKGILKAKPKTTLFVCKLHYPLWAVPWENESLIVDGLGIFSATIKFEVLPDVTLFIDDIERSASLREQFFVALEKHEDTFNAFAENVQIPESALITDAELLSTLSEYTREARSLNLDKHNTGGLLPLKLNQQNAVERAQEILDLQKQIHTDIRALEYSKNLLATTESFHEKMILKEVEHTRKAYEIEISKLQPTVKTKVDRLLKERDARIVKITRLAQNELREREREMEKREGQLRKLELTKTSFLNRRQTRRRKHDKIGTAHWEHRIQINENKIREAKSRIRALSEFIEKTRRQNEENTETLRRGYQESIDLERSRILNIEAQRDKAVEAKQKEIETLRLATNRILGDIEELAELRRKRENELKKLAIPLGIEDVTLLCPPFYLAGYQAEDTIQLQIFPPCRVMSSEGIVKTLQKTIRSFREASRVEFFLQPRSTALSKMLNFVCEIAGYGKTFSESLMEATTANNLLEKQNFWETLTKGVEKLKAEGWITESQGDSLLKAYA
jgi:hypothetical protein